MSCAYINNLPDLCLLKIFDQLTLVKLLQMKQVCSRWRNLNKSATCRRRSFTLNIGHEPSELVAKSVFVHQVPQHQSLNTLSFKFIVWRYTDLICSTLPNVKKLTICANRIDSSFIKYLIYLLQNWAPNLATLRLYINFAIPYTEHEDSKIIENIHNIFQLLNRMPRLKNLLIESPRCFSKDEPLSLTVLSKLNEFYFYTLDSLNFVYDSLQKFGQTSDHLRKICFGDNGQFDQKLLQRMLQLDPKFAFRFAQLSFTFTPGLAQYELNRLCRHFTGLNSLTLSLDDLPLSQLTNCLANLKALTHLGLSIDFSRESRALHLEDSLSPNEFSPLSSVKHLKLCIRPVSHRDLNFCHMGLIFPKLRNITVEGNFPHCELCDNEEQNHRVSDDKLRQCLRLLFASFKQCMKEVPKSVTAML